MDKTQLGWINGGIGMVIFSGSLPATRAALAGFDPFFVTAARGSTAGLLAAAVLLLGRQGRPQVDQLASLGIVAMGVVVGFPLLTGLALRDITAADSLVFIGLLPLSTAVFAVLRGGERPRPAFWLFSTLGACLLIGYACGGSGGISLRGDSLMLAAIAVCGLGYAEGGRLSRSMGGSRVICWALILSLPLNGLATLAVMPHAWVRITPSAWLGLAYVSVFSMLLGFVFWYRGLALAGTAAVGQLQLLQPFIGMTVAAVILHEVVAWPMVAISAAIVLCVAGARSFA